MWYKIGPKYWLLLLPLMLGSEGPHPMTTPMTRLVYRYQGPAIPPPYQRTIEVTIDAEKSRLIVTCVDEVLVNREQPAPANILIKLAQWLQADHLSALPRHSNVARQPPMTGAGMHTLKIYHGQQLVMDASTAQFADQATAILSGDIESFANRLRQAIPHNAADWPTP